MDRSKRICRDPQGNRLGFQARTRTAGRSQCELTVALDLGFAASIGKTKLTIPATTQRFLCGPAALTPLSPWCSSAFYDECCEELKERIRIDAVGIDHGVRLRDDVVGLRTGPNRLEPSRPTTCQQVEYNIEGAFRR